MIKVIVANSAFHIHFSLCGMFDWAEARLRAHSLTRVEFWKHAVAAAAKSWNPAASGIRFPQASSYAQEWRCDVGNAQSAR